MAAVAAVVAVVAVVAVEADVADVAAVVVVVVEAVTSRTRRRAAVVIVAAADVGVLATIVPVTAEVGMIIAAVLAVATAGEVVDSVVVSVVVSVVAVVEEAAVVIVAVRRKLSRNQGKSKRAGTAEVGHTYSQRGEHGYAWGSVKVYGLASGLDPDTGCTPPPPLKTLTTGDSGIYGFGGPSDRGSGCIQGSGGRKFVSRAFEGVLRPGKPMW